MSNALISASCVSRSFGGKPLFKDLTLAINEQERVALIGPNGSGKSTLLKILARLHDPDEGDVSVRRGLAIGYVEQSPSFPDKLSVRAALEAAVAKADIPDYEQRMRIDQIQEQISFADLDQLVSELSGGWRKRLAIATALLREPDVLILDEPTNHLDIDGILWLEQFLLKSRAALLFVSHDRYFIDRLSTRVVELDRRYPLGTFSTKGTYSDFLLAREEFLEILERSEQTLANKVRREVEWLRQGAKARTTKSKHRSSEAHRLVGELNASNLTERSTDFNLTGTGRRSQELISLKQVSKSLGGKRLFTNLDLLIAPGVRLGIVGPNGSGKTTLIKTLLDQTTPDSGSITRAKNLRIAFFDQERKALDPNLTLKKALCDEGDSVVFAGQNLHVAALARKFLFRTEQLPMPVGSLSGGEQARVLLARVIREEADILFFDEPTNDLDIQTLEVLEDSFVQFPGAIVLVTHDRHFMDRVATIVVGLGASGPTPCFADYSQWEKSRKSITAKQSSSANSQGYSSSLNPEERRKKLRQVEKSIEKEEKKLAQLQEKILNPELAGNHLKLTELGKEINSQQELIAQFMLEWETLAE
jgi:ABC transport system ATP-binding/permease protein